MSESHLHSSHPEIAKRLKRAEGHLRKIIEMMDAGRPCLELAHQLHAVGSAIEQAKKVLIRDHMDHCLEDAVGPLSPEQQRSIAEFKEIARYL